MTDRFDLRANTPREPELAIRVVAARITRYRSPMLWNIIDRRTRPYRWRQVNAIVEATDHDNSCVDSDQAPESEPTLTVHYEALEAISMSEAVKWAEGQPCPVTLYLYDLGSGFRDEEHFTNMEVRFEEIPESEHLMIKLRALSAFLAAAVGATPVPVSAGELAGPARFCGYSPIIDLLDGESVTTL